MLANRLNVLLAERQLSIKDLVTQTGLSRSAVSNIVNNPSANVSTDTIDVLCRELEISPQDFFLYSPYHFEFGLKSEGIAVSATLGKKEKIYWVDYFVTESEDDLEENQHLAAFDLYISLDPDGALGPIRESLPVAFRHVIDDGILRCLQKGLKQRSQGVDVEVEGGSLRDVGITTFLHNTTTEQKARVSISLPWIDFQKKIDVDTLQLSD